ncbi:MAG: molybdenum cofactor guanylyltransferase [Acidimicrobiia bacterium]|nr:molybdenum cofactor guanylyltransferase [Acidimicrobiia bacterium]
MRKTAGFVLAGGNSSRMGADKALLSLGGTTLLVQACRHVEQAAGQAVVIGPPERYAHLGLREVIPDVRAGLGPLGGIHTALSLRRAEWNLIVACDMPALDLAVLNRLIKEAEAADPGCLMPVDGAGREHPLCAVYHRECLAAVEAAIGQGQFKVREALRGVTVKTVQIHDSECFLNLNTPADWEALAR